MTAALIFAISFLTLMQFFVSYCHSLIAESRGHELSESAREISGVTGRTAHGDQFRRLLQLLSLCPDPGGDTTQVRAVSTYFRLLSLARAVCGWAVPGVTEWMQSESGGCAYVLAVVLDKRIAYNRMLMSEQTSH
jgi:hypothetical protein